MNEFYAENFLQACSKGNIEECKKLLQQGVDVNHTDKEGNYYQLNKYYQIMPYQKRCFRIIQCCNEQLIRCVQIFGQQQCQVFQIYQLMIKKPLYFIQYIKYFKNNQISLETQNKENQTPLHLACDKGSKEIVLFLVTNGFDTTVKNGAGQKPGEGTMEMKIFINNLSSENKAFDALKSNHKTKLQQIFDDIDTDNAKCIDLQKAIVFNKFVEDNLNDQAAEKDARDFIKTAGLCNQTTVNIDEWYFSFAKLYAVDPQTYDKFIEEYDKAVEKKGKIRFQGN